MSLGRYMTAPMTERWGSARRRGTGASATYKVERLHDGRVRGTIRCNDVVRGRVGEPADVEQWINKMIERV